jgi:hypothetical protein
MHQSIVDICINDAGIAAILSAKSFCVLQQDESVPVIEVDVQDHHSSSCTAICCSKSASPSYQHASTSGSSTTHLPKIFIASRCTLSSWKALNHENCIKYYFQSKINLRETKEMVNPTLLRLSSCQSALTLCIGSIVSVFAAAANLGLAHCKY